MFKKLVFCSIALFVVNCFSPMKILKENGNSYLYSKIAGSKIGFCAPIVKSTSIDLKDNTNIFRPDSMHDEQTSEIKSHFIID